LRIIGSSVGAISVSSETLKESSVLRVYVIDLSSVGIPGHWAEPSLIRAYFEKYAFVELINTWDKLDRLIRNSPSKAVVVNAHGELVPMPATWSNWKEYFIEIGRNMRNRGWIWVSTKGYPFYYVYTEATSEKITGTPSERLFVFYDDTEGDPAVSGSIAIRYGEGFLQLDGYSIAMVKSSEAFAMLLYKKFFDG